MKQNKFILTVFLIILCSVLVSSVSVENLTLDSTSGYNLTTDNLTCNFDLNDTATTSAVSWYNNKSGTFQPDMALYLPFEGNETNALLDMSGYNRDATVTGATWSSTNGHHDDNGGFYFDNGNDNLNFGDVLDITPTDNFTIMFWINKDAAQTDAIITKSNTIGSVGWSVSLESDNEMVFRMDSATTTMRTGNDNAYDNVVGTWEHWAITYPGTADNADIKMYKNGAQVTQFYAKNTLTTSDTTTNSEDLVIGETSSGASDFGGYLDDIRIYKRVLNQKQIEFIYQNNSHLIYYNETILGETWQCRVTPFSSTTAGTTVNSNNLTITELTPVTSTPVLSSTSGNNLTTDNLTCSYTLTDATSSAVSWYRNDSLGDMQPNMLLYLPFEGNSTNALKDYSGSGNDFVSASGNPFWNSTGRNATNGAYYFDGTDDYIEDSDGENYINGLSQITIATWVKLDSIGTDRAFFDTELPDVSDDVLGLRYDNSGTDGCSDCFKTALTTSVGNVQLEFGDNVDFSKWVFVAIRWSSGNSLDSYINGVKNESSSSLFGTISGADRVIVGNGVKGTTNSWYGHVDDFMIFNDSLSDEQIKALYNNRIDLIVSQETSDGETWQCRVTPFSSYNSGETISSNIMVINPIIIESVILNSTTNITDSNLTCNIQTNIDTRDSVVWYENGESLLLLNLPFNSYEPLTDLSPNTSSLTNNGADFSINGGYFYNAYDFNTAGDFVNVSNIEKINNRVNLSFGAWVYTRSSGVSNIYGRILQKGIDITNGEFNLHYDGNNNDVKCYINGSSTDSSILNYDEWYHVMCTYDGENIKLYINGMLNSSTVYVSSGNITSSGSNLFIGNRETGDRTFDGIIDEVQIWGKVLSGNQIKNIYNNQSYIYDSTELSIGNYSCGVYSTNYYDYDGEVLSNQLSIIDELPININITYPEDGRHYNDDTFTGNMTIQTDINGSCNINDTRFTNVFNNETLQIFQNNTINITQKIDINVNCTSTQYGTTDEQNLTFYLDLDDPFIDFTSPSEGEFLDTLFAEIFAYIEDTFLDATNITVYNETGSVVYENFTTYTNITQVNLTNIINLTSYGDGIYTFEVCSRDSLEDSPIINETFSFPDQFENDDEVIDYIKNNINISLKMDSFGRRPYDVVYHNINITTLETENFDIEPIDINIGGRSYEYIYGNESNEYKIYFRDVSSKKKKKHILIENNGYIFTYQHENFINFEPHRIATNGRVATLQNVPITVESDKAYYANQYRKSDGGDDFAHVEYTFPSNDVVKENYIIWDKSYLIERYNYHKNSDNDYNITNLQIGSIIFAFTKSEEKSMGFRTDRVNMKSFDLFEDKTYSTTDPFFIYDENEKVIFSIPELYVNDSEGNIIVLNKTFNIKPAGNLEFIINIPFKWLNETAVYPIYIDPTIISHNEENFTSETFESYNVDDVTFCESPDIDVLRTISLRNTSGIKLNLTDYDWNRINEWEDGGRHMKTLWYINKTGLEWNFSTVLSYECLGGCDRMIYLNDRGRDRIIDDGYHYYNHFDDVESEGWNVEYKQVGDVVEVWINAPNETFFNDLEEYFEVDPIAGGLNKICDNKTITIDTTNPEVILNSPDNDSIIIANSVLLNYTITELNTKNATLYFDGVPVQNHNESGTYTYDTGSSYGSHNWYINVTDETDKNNLSETRTYVLYEPLEIIDTNISPQPLYSYIDAVGTENSNADTKIFTWYINGVNITSAYNNNTLSKDFYIKGDNITLETRFYKTAGNQFAITNYSLIVNSTCECIDGEDWILAYKDRCTLNNYCNATSVSFVDSVGWLRINNTLRTPDFRYMYGGYVYITQSGTIIETS